MRGSSGVSVVKLNTNSQGDHRGVVILILWRWFTAPVVVYL